MSRRLVLLLAVAVAAFIAGRGSLADDEPPKTVKAKHYRVRFSESGLVLSLGGGRWVDEVFLPEAKVAASLVFDRERKATAPGTPIESVSRVRLCTYPAEKPRNDMTGPSGQPSPIDEVDIPADLAKQIVDLATLTARQQAETLRLGTETAQRLGWKEIPRDP